MELPSSSASSTSSSSSSSSVSVNGASTRSPRDSDREVSEALNSRVSLPSACWGVLVCQKNTGTKGPSEPVELIGDVWVGRSAGCLVRVRDRQVAHRHCQLSVRSGRPTLECFSVVPVLVSDTPVRLGESVDLHDRDTLTFTRKNGKQVTLELHLTAPREKRFNSLVRMITGKKKHAVQQTNVPLYLTASAWCYTQVLEHVVKGTKLQGDKHGGIRDCVRVRVFSPNLAVVAVCDGAGLQFWSEVAARVASEAFLAYMEDFFSCNAIDSLQIADIKTQMRRGVIHANKVLIGWRHPLTQERVNIFDLGGQTTLVATVVFCLREEWGAISVGTGDSPSYHFRAGEAALQSADQTRDQPQGKSEAGQEGTTGQWERMFGDQGEMLPFYGLQENNILEPYYAPAQPGDMFFCFSDGVTDSLPARVPPRVPLHFQHRVCDATAYILAQTYLSHEYNRTDPDDVAIGGICIAPHWSRLGSGERASIARASRSSTFSEPTQGYPFDESAVDLTTKLYPNFTAVVPMPWGTYCYPSPDVLPEEWEEVFSTVMKDSLTQFLNVAVPLPMNEAATTLSSTATSSSSSSSFSSSSSSSASSASSFVSSPSSTAAATSSSTPPVLPALHGTSNGPTTSSSSSASSSSSPSSPDPTAKG